ncbi:11616_t:CDS:2, partial [Funneliformis mosseae]
MAPGEADTEILLKRLYSKKMENPRWIISMKLDPEERYQEENDYCEFVNWKQMIPQIGCQNIANAIFRLVIEQLKEFVMRNILKKQKEQMSLSLYYYATEVELEVVLSKEQ